MEKKTDFSGSLVNSRFSPAEFRTLASKVQAVCGIKLPDQKQVMVEGRLRKHLRELGFVSFHDYYKFLFNENGFEQELSTLIDFISTNKTDFFREPVHFEDMISRMVPDLAAKTGAGFRRPLRVWSSAASNGAEAYTIAMVLADYYSQHPDFSFHVFGTDICSDVLAKARQAIYPEDMMAPIPAALKKKYIMIAKKQGRHEFRIVPELRKVVTFRRMNLINPVYPFNGAMDIIFCRNVMIYFDKDNQKRTVLGLCERLTKDGFLVMGHAENLNQLTGLPLKQVKPTIYRRS